MRAAYRAWANRSVVRAARGPETHVDRLGRALAAIGVAFLVGAGLAALVSLAVGPAGWPGRLASWAGISGGLAKETAVVERVIDGDTLVVAGGASVRLLAIDAPETHNPNMDREQPFGREAAQRLEGLVAGRRVELERDVSEADHYGRLLRHVWVDGVLVSEVLVREGLAHAGSIPPDLRHGDRLRQAEQEARAEGRGLWGEARPTPLPIFEATP